MEEKNIPNLPNPLTKNQVDAVRFQVTKPGYSFEQVEAFIEKTKTTLEFLEYEMKKDKLALAEAEDEIELLSDRAQTLSATLEIFKVKGDALVSESGEFLTESAVAKNNKLAEENEYLKQQLLLAQEDANAGWQAEAELRKYIEEQLLPWLNENKEAIVQNVAAQEQESATVIAEEEIETVPAGYNVEPDLTNAKAETQTPAVDAEEDEIWSEADTAPDSEHPDGDPNLELSPEDILYEDEMDYEEHVIQEEQHKPLLSSEDENDWFK